MISATPHPDPETLLRLVDDDLTAAEAAELEVHLAACGDCREKSRVLGETLGDYFRFHAAVLKPSLPPVPREWDRLELLMEEPSARRIVPFRPRVWLAMAATIALAFVLIRRFEHAPAVDAAELLTRASVAERSAVRHTGRIRIRTRHAKWDRPASLSTPAAGEAVDVQNLLIAAGYPTDDPLSAAAFSQWRHGVPEKRDQVTEQPGTGAVESYLVHTSPTGGVVADASLTLRARDLHAITCILHFRSDETIEMTEMADEAIVQSPQPMAAPLAPEPRPEVVAARPAGPAEELQVVAALHRIGADLGEPVEVKREGGAVHVTVSGVTARRQEEVRSALAGIPGVDMQTGTAAAHDVRAGLPPRRNIAQPDSPSPLIAELQATLGNDTSPTELANQLIDSTDSSIERAYALRGLARRFPPASASQLNPPERGTLNAILRDHLERLAQSIESMRQLLAPILPGGATPSMASSPAGDWQGLAEAMLTSVQEVDRELNASADGNGDIAARKARLAQALGNLGKQIAALRKVVQP